MSLCAQLLRTARIPSVRARRFSTAMEPARLAEEPIQTVRTTENNPVNHTSEHLHRFYTIPKEAKEQLFRPGSFITAYQKQIDTFMELAILIRSPALELISLLNRTDYTKPVNKFVLYGKLGSGKTSTLVHIVHYAMVTKKVLVHVPCVSRWFKHPKEVTPSQTRPGFYDLPIDGASWLVHFKQQNFHLLSELDLRVSKDYVWSARESTKAGAPLMELVDLGINRVKYACDIIYALTDELKFASTAGKCSTLVAIHGFNGFFARNSFVKAEFKKIVLPDKVSLTEAFVNMTKYDWCNGAVVVVVDRISALSSGVTVLPRSLLGEKGFEHLDPFLPILVDEFSTEEFDAMIEYYKERKWIRNMSDEAKRELEMLSNRNPHFLMKYSASL